ncbi:4'-phosphopantetheinyl transferase family protein [Candidatus Marithrix sp. Canyon 246]|uniref:4'-phosphopantetheinyl transferase family protein n=1 Tax=Candidatus Marithrix sp. Canyon 246 TaxID=1827136 RepID=UPI000849F940|nr:4'-phosphopantetheinyl transferase superfamily protein [Candidatus Marithrix sp. Canyon 246]
MVKIFYTHFTSPLSIEQWQIYFCQLPKNIQQKISNFRRWQDQHAALFSKLLLKHALRQAGYNSDCLNQLKYELYNRPFIDNKIDFNISHAGEYVVCAISDQGRLGIDIELIKAINISDFNQYMETKPLSYKEFYEIWTIKEAVIKADGRGLSIPLLDIKLDINKAYLYDKTWNISKIDIGINYVCHLVTSWQNNDINMEGIKF